MQEVSTRSSLRGDLTRLGLAPGALVMVHAALRSVGPITGGVNVLVQALQDMVGPEGTLMAYADFEPFYEDSDEVEVPVFDKRIARAARDYGVLPETLRTWPGALRSDHPDAGVVAIGAKAEWLTRDHPFQQGYGQRTPFEKALQAGVQVLTLGSPLDRITLLHYAEFAVNIPDKRMVRYRRRMPGPDGPEWVDFEEFDTGDPVNSACRRTASSRSPRLISPPGEAGQAAWGTRIQRFSMALAWCSSGSTGWRRTSVPAAADKKWGVPLRNAPPSAPAIP